jgi:type VI secretion system secreted protein VgrG
MATYTQQKRFLKVATPLGDDAMFLAGFRGQEAMSSMFGFHLELLSANQSITAKDIVGKNVTFSVVLPDGTERFFNGFVNRFQAGPMRAEGMRRYRAEVVPWLWFLSQRQNCRIFQNKKVADIIEAIFKELNFNDYELKLKKTSYKPREYCVQYRESDANFLGRLMEEEGIYYFFRHENGKHVMVIGDDASSYLACAEAEVEYLDGSLAPNHINAWDHQYGFCAGKWTMVDYNFEKPSTSLLASAKTVLTLPGIDKYEVYQPGTYAEKADGEALAKLRMEQVEANYETVNAASNCRSFVCAGKFKLKRHEVKDEVGKNYVITSISYEASDETYFNAGGGQSYSNSFNCIPANLPCRPSLQSEIPRIYGPQTAVVVGPKGEEIYTDKYGRIKVQFHWDREGKKDENSSCWVRVAQSWAGNKFGVQFIPRISQEVVVEFIDGDPDQPIVTGVVYNAEQMPPWALPDNKTQSGIKTLSSKGGGGANELRFEDKKDAEEIYVHAQKDLNQLVKNDATETVERDARYTVNRDKFTEIKNDFHETIKRDELREVGRDQNLKVKGKHATEVEKSFSLTVKEDVSEVFKKNHSVEVTKDHTLKAENIVFEATKNITLKVGQTSLVLASDGLSVSTTGKVELKGTQGVTIEGTSGVKIEGTGEVSVKSKSTVAVEGTVGATVSGLKTDVTAKAMLTLQGTLVKIN